MINLLLLARPFTSMPEYVEIQNSDRDPLLSIYEENPRKLLFGMLLELYNGLAEEEFTIEVTFDDLPMIVRLSKAEGEFRFLEHGVVGYGYPTLERFLNTMAEAKTIRLCKPTAEHTGEKTHD